MKTKHKKIKLATTFQSTDHNKPKQRKQSFANAKRHMPILTQPGLTEKFEIAAYIQKNKPG